MKTLTDFKRTLTNTKKYYLDIQVKHGLLYTFTEEDLGTIHYAMIANHTQATKIIFDSEQGIIVKREIYNQDVQTFLDLQKQLKGGL